MVTFYDVTQPRISDLTRGRIDLFGLDSLVTTAAAAGLHIQISITEVAQDLKLRIEGVLPTNAHFARHGHLLVFSSPPGISRIPGPGTALAYPGYSGSLVEELLRFAVT